MLDEEFLTTNLTLSPTSVKHLPTCLKSKALGRVTVPVAVLIAIFTIEFELSQTSAAVRVLVEEAPAAPVRAGTERSKSLNPAENNPLIKFATLENSEPAAPKILTSLTINCPGLERAKTDKSKEPATNTTPNPTNTLFIFSFYLLFYDLSFLKILKI